MTNLSDLDEIYKNLLTAFDPAAKRLVQAGRDLVKAWKAVTEANRAYADALERLGTAGSKCHGETGEIGHCLLQIADTVKILNKHDRNTVCSYEERILAPTEGNLDQDSKVIIEQRKEFDKTQKQMIHRLKKDKKKGVPIEESKRMLMDYQADCMKKALTEEKKRYTYMLDRHCALVSLQLRFHRTALSLYEQRMPKWEDACTNPEELSTAALAALDAAIQPYATQSVASTVSRIGAKSMLNDDMEMISTIPSPPPPNSKQQGLETFRTNEDDGVKETLDAASGMLRGHHEIHRQRLVDSPSTGSSTVSNGSRPAMYGEQPLAAQKRAPSMSSLVKNTNGHALMMIGSNGHQHNPAPEEISLRPTVPDTASASPPGIIPIPTNGSSMAERRRVVAVFAYNNAAANQLKFEAGDTILVIQNGQHGWQYGENASSGKRGWYPASFTKPCDTSAQQHRPRSLSSSLMTDDPGQERSNVCNGNGVKQKSVGTASGTRINEFVSNKVNPRPLTMMVLEPEEDVTSSYRYRQAPPPPPPMSSTSGQSSDQIANGGKETKTSHTINYDTVPKHNPFGHVKLRHVMNENDGPPKKYG